MLVGSRRGESITFCGISGDAEPAGQTPTGGGYVSNTAPGGRKDTPSVTSTPALTAPGCAL